MKTTVSILVMGAMLGATAHAEEIDPRNFQIKSVSVHEVPVNSRELSTTAPILNCNSSPQPPAAMTGLLPSPTPAPGNPLDPINGIINTITNIVNLGQKIWAIVEAGAPTSSVKTDSASALPSGAKCWTDLQQWHAPQVKAFQVDYKNGFNIDVVKMTYQVIWVAGGNVEGIGQYIAYASIMPTNIDMKWGFKLNSTLTIPTVFNMGTKEQPIAGMQIQIDSEVTSTLSDIHVGQAYFLDGSGNLQVIQ